jgi:hypothetical protein
VSDLDLRAAALPELEGVIERGLATFVEVGTALAEIRERRLYRETHGDFDTYCRERWGWSARHANRQIEAAAVVSSLGPIGLEPSDEVEGLTPNGTRPTNEAQVRELARVEPERRADVWREASENGPPTAARIREAAAPVVAPPPPEALAARERRDEVESIGSSLKVVGDAVFALRRSDSSALALAEVFTGPLAEEARASVGLPTYPVTPEAAREAAAFLLALADYIEERNGNGPGS